MVDEKTLYVSLEEFGLSKYEAKAYVTLVSKGTISASELSYYSGLPRTKTYPVLLKLENKKLAIISKSKPIMCTAIAPEDAFDDIIQDQINKINEMNALVSNLKKTSEQSKKSRGAEEKRYFHLTPNNVLDQLRMMIKGSKSSIHIMTDQWGLSLLAECKEQLVSVLRRDLEVKIIVPPSQAGSESFKIMPDDTKIRISDVVQNCFIFDQTELLLIDSDNGKGATFSSTDVLGANQERLFSHVWKNSLKTDCFGDMVKAEVQEIYKIIKLVDDNALNHVLNSTFVSNDNKTSLLSLLEKNGVDLKTKQLDEMIEIIDAALQLSCSGHANFDAKNKNISIESKMNSGHSLPWVAILDEYLQKQGFKTRVVYQNNTQKGEKVHIKN